jgi:hypothetical protein
MGETWKTLRWVVTRDGLAGLALKCFWIVCVCILAAAPAGAQVATNVHDSESSQRLLTPEEGRSIVDVAWQQDPPETGVRDCSHLVHQIYVSAGFEYPYASSFEIYAGNESFERVKTPHAGDLVAWPGHVGIVVDPLQHSFYSLVRTGWEAQDYEGPYWRSRGRPRFYRYVVGTAAVMSAMTTAGSAGNSNGHISRIRRVDDEERNTVEKADPNRPPTTTYETSARIYGPPAPRVTEVAKNEEEGPTIPQSVIIASESRVPTREEVAEGISELDDTMGSVLRSENPLKREKLVVIVEQFRVERIDIKHDHGWARLSIDAKASISGGTAQVKRRHEKIRWELRRTAAGWEAFPPTDRSYVPQDVAVKNLAANLAQLASSDGAAKHQQAVLKQESQIAGLLNALLENKKDH